jgi:YfiH family protein
MTTCGWELGAAAADSTRAWAQVEEAVGVPLLRVRQVHGANVLVRRAGDTDRGGMPDADVIISIDPTVAIAIQTADCVPLLIVDRRTGAVAAAHAGWRGLAAAVPRAAIEALQREFAARPSDLVVAAGPSIGPCCYEVGEDVMRCFLNAGFAAATLARWFLDRALPTAVNPSMPGRRAEVRVNHWYFDSARAAGDQVQSAGVPADQIFLAGLCTASHPGALCSYRRDGVGAGRMAAVIRASAPRIAP